jgi:Flp pilus assembly protein TadG
MLGFSHWYYPNQRTIGLVGHRTYRCREPIFRAGNVATICVPGTIHGRRRPRGQAIVELALLLPILTAFLGGAIDLARVYRGWLTLQSATRNAAEYVATDDTDSTAAQTDALRIICTESQGIPGFVAGSGGDVATCTSPAVSIQSYVRSATAPGASSRYPIVSVTVRASVDFQMLFHWPILPPGGWTLTSTQSYSVVQGR